MMNTDSEYNRHVEQARRESEQAALNVARTVHVHATVQAEWSIFHACYRCEVNEGLFHIVDLPKFAWYGYGNDRYALSGSPLGWAVYICEECRVAAEAQAGLGNLIADDYVECGMVDVLEAELKWAAES